MAATNDVLERFWGTLLQEDDVMDRRAQEEAEREQRRQRGFLQRRRRQRLLEQQQRQQAQQSKTLNNSNSNSKDPELSEQIHQAMEKVFDDIFFETSVEPQQQKSNGRKWFKKRRATTQG